MKMAIFMRKDHTAYPSVVKAFRDGDARSVGKHCRADICSTPLASKMVSIEQR
jgi:hypothetical protein